jgi:alpha-beta hydrolase superfamily lysophospholipase
MSRLEHGFFPGSDNLRLYWESTWPDETPIAHLALIHGYADHSGRYRQTAEALASMGLAVHAFDYRGHGQADGRRGHCEIWSQFLDDLNLFWARVQNQAQGQKVFVLGHSHGGLMAVHFLSKATGVAGAILSAPYLGLAITPNPLQVWAAKAVGRFVPYFPQKLPIPPEDLTRDQTEQSKVKNDPLYNRTLTVGWFVEANKAQVEAWKLGEKIQLPLFLILGDHDRVASSDSSREFFQTIGSQEKMMKVYPGMRHEPLNEVGREQVWKDIFEWIRGKL